MLLITQNLIVQTILNKHLATVHAAISKVLLVFLYHMLGYRQLFMKGSVLLSEVSLGTCLSLMMPQTILL